MTTVFSDTSTLQGLFQHTKFLTGQDSLKIEDFTRLANFALDDYSDIAMKSTLHWKFDDATNTTDHPIATHDVTAGRNDYALDVNFLTIDSVEWNDGSKWQRLEQIDRKDKDTPLSTIYSSEGEPTSFDFDGRSVFLYPTPSTGGEERLKVYYSRPANYFDVTDTTATIGIPRVHHEYIALHAGYRLTMRTSDAISATLRNELQKKEDAIRDFYSKRDKTRARKLKGIINVAK